MQTLIGSANPSSAGPAEVTRSKIAVADVGPRIHALDPREFLTLVGIDHRAVADAVAHPSLRARSALLIEGPARASTELILDEIIEDLAAIALERFPHWYGCDEISPERMLRHASGDRAVSAPWLRAAARRASAGHSPRFRRAARALEFNQLLRAIDGMGPVLIAALDPTSRETAAPMIQVLEWCVARGASVVATFPTHPPPSPPFDRVLHGALQVFETRQPARERFIPARARAHHASAVEQRIEAALRRDGELGPLFCCNETVAINGLGSPPRVDLLWREGRVVVELDGPDHQEDPKFANDRHRDFELLTAGYLVLRITNQQVETDLQMAVEKIRAVVRYRQSLGKA